MTIRRSAAPSPGFARLFGGPAGYCSNGFVSFSDPDGNSRTFYGPSWTELDATHDCMWGLGTWVTL